MIQNLLPFRETQTGEDLLSKNTLDFYFILLKKQCSTLDRSQTKIKN
jgi:hypothetical protein